MKSYIASSVRVLAQFSDEQEIRIVLWMIEDDELPVGMVFKENDAHLYPVTNDEEFVQYVYGDE